MGQPAAKQGDRVVATDIHLIQPPGPSSPVPTPHPFIGVLDAALSTDVTIEGRPAATVDSIAHNGPPHVPIGGSFVKPPANQGRIVRGSANVTINGKPVARAGDIALTCNDPVDQPVGQVVAAGTVLVGG
jgi:uncharacterized Zn-binding protein involved in type VI secretion